MRSWNQNHLIPYYLHPYDLLSCYMKISYKNDASYVLVFLSIGTDFMARLQEQLKYFVHNKLSTDKSWQGVNVYLSGHEVSS